MKTDKEMRAMVAAQPEILKRRMHAVAVAFLERELPKLRGKARVNALRNLEQAKSLLAKA